VATLEVTTGGGAALFPDSPVWDVQTQGERREEILVTQRGMTPGPVSYLRQGHVCMRQLCGRHMGLGQGAMYMKTPQRDGMQAGVPGWTPSHAGLTTTSHYQYTKEGRPEGPPQGNMSASSLLSKLMTVALAPMLALN